MKLTLIFKKYRAYYRISAVALLDAAIVFICLNVIIGISFYFKDHIVPKLDRGIKENLFQSSGAPVKSDKRSSHQVQWFDYTAYEQIVAESYAGEVLDGFYELAKHGFIYQPWVQFSEPQYQGKRVNIDLDSKGFPIRRTINLVKDQSPLVQIFILGGSTTFGYNVSDEHTWPSFLSKILTERAAVAGLKIQIEVTNYGRGFYTTSQETALFIDLLRSGYRPSLVVFMGGNWGPQQDVPRFTDEIERKFQEVQFGSQINALKWVPVVRLVKGLKDLSREANSSQPRLAAPSIQDQEEYVNHVSNRFTANRKIAAKVGELYSLDTLFFLEPDAAYNYPDVLYRSSLADSRIMRKQLRTRFYRQIKNTSGAIDLTNLFELWGHDRKAIVDRVHYSPNFNRFLAQHVADRIDLNSLVPVSIDKGDSLATGAHREQKKSVPVNR